MKVFLGIDTSAYTTSLAAVNENFHILADERILLEVEHGKRGLRQSELFLHVKTYRGLWPDWIPFYINRPARWESVPVLETRKKAICQCF